MNFTKFQEALIEEIRIISCNEGLEVFLEKLTKNNGITTDVLCIRDRGEAMAPLIYLEDSYSQYQKGIPLLNLAQNILRQYHDDLPKITPPSLDSFGDFKRIHQNIYCRIVNYEMNTALLSRIPSRRILDLAITYYYQVDDSFLKNATITITNEHLNKWNIEEHTLYTIAWKNTIDQLPCDVENIEETLRELMTPEELNELFFPSIPDPNFVPMHIITNSHRCMGAICILYPESLRDFSESLNSNLYILPSSIHECILVPEHKAYSKEDLEEMVVDINATQVAPQEILSNKVYYYDRKKDLITF